MNRPFSVFLLLAVLACVEEAPLTPFPEQVLPATITATDLELEAGETSTITVSITNTLDEVVQLVFPTSCQAVVFIRNSRGRVTTPPNGNYICAGVPSSLTLAVGETRSFATAWGAGIDFGAAGTSARVPPGQYYASAELRADNYHGIAFPILIVVH